MTFTSKGTSQTAFFFFFFLAWSNFHHMKAKKIQIKIQYEKFQAFWNKKTRKSPDSEGEKGRKIYKSPDLDSELLQVKWPELWPTLAHASDG